MHQIENGFLRVKARESGAELTSVLNKKNGVEHLWQANPQFWNWHSPVLFPVVGRCLEDEIDIAGKKFHMEKHGFARRGQFRLLDLTDTKMVFSLKSNEQFRKIYPYLFELLIAYKLTDNSLTVSYEVINKDTQPMPFSIGGHPAFNVPFLEGENYDDYSLQFEQTESVDRHFINTDGFFDGRTAPVLANSDTLPLKPNLFRDDALIFKNLQSRKVTVRNKNNPHYLTVDFNGFDYLGLWAKVDAPYLCIEPWLGCADTVDKPTEYKDKEGVITLAQEAKMNVSYTITIG